MKKDFVQKCAGEHRNAAHLLPIHRHAELRQKPESGGRAPARGSCARMPGCRRGVPAEGYIYARQQLYARCIGDRFFVAVSSASTTTSIRSREGAEAAIFCTSASYGLLILDFCPMTCGKAGCRPPPPPRPSSRPSQAPTAVPAEPVGTDASPSARPSQARFRELIG